MPPRPPRAAVAVPEVPDPDVPLIPWAASTALTNPGRERRLAAWQGALAAGLPALLLTLPVRSLTAAAGSFLAGTFGAVAPGFLVPYLVLGSLLLAPIALALPAALSAAVAVRRRASGPRDLAQATAAGAGMGTMAVAAGVIALQALSFGDFLLAPLWAAAAALGVGLVGGAAFAQVPTGKAEERAPAAYTAFLSAGLGAPALLAGAAAWGTLSHFVTFLSPWYLASLLLPGPVASAAALGVGVTALAPVTYLTARALARGRTDRRPAAVAVGLMVPPAIPFLCLFGVLALYFEAPLIPALVTALGGALAIAVHGFAALSGVASANNSRRRLPAADPI
jgi:hypothetical protein